MSKTLCLTPGTNYQTSVSAHGVTVSVTCPASINLGAPTNFGNIESRIHDALEWALAPWFYFAIDHHRRMELIRMAYDRRLKPNERRELNQMENLISAVSAFQETPPDNEAMNIVRRAAVNLRERKRDTK